MSCLSLRTLKALTWKPPERRAFATSLFCWQICHVLLWWSMGQSICYLAGVKSTAWKENPIGWKLKSRKTNDCNLRKVRIRVWLKTRPMNSAFGYGLIAAHRRHTSEPCIVYFQSINIMVCVCVFHSLYYVTFDNSNAPLNYGCS